MRKWQVYCSLGGGYYRLCDVYQRVPAQQGRYVFACKLIKIYMNNLSGASELVIGALSLRYLIGASSLGHHKWYITIGTLSL